MGSLRYHQKKPGFSGKPGFWILVVLGNGSAGTSHLAPLYPRMSASNGEGGALLVIGVNCSLRGRAAGLAAKPGLAIWRRHGRAAKVSDVDRIGSDRRGRHSAGSSPTGSPIFGHPGRARRCIESVRHASGRKREGQQSAARRTLQSARTAKIADRTDLRPDCNSQTVPDT